ncbi:hypothetical protein MNBD_NITROSPIRAE01-1165 [hydrothermal vent metagenome]|uniref:Uncharacterized protein n=1 Tax=hydrothermal vent metagenome TaxID=652676 RepID=A0A3B1D391_9ZZZZ
MNLSSVILLIGRRAFVLFFVLFFFLSDFGVTLGLFPVAEAGDRDASMIEVLEHGYRIDETWEKIGKTKYYWKVTFQNHSNKRKRVFAYYSLLSAKGLSLARNVSNRYVGPQETVEIVGDSYIMTQNVPLIVDSHVKLKVGFPN